MEQGVGSSPQETVEQWLASLMPAEGLGVQAGRVLAQLCAAPGLASHSSAAEVADSAGVSQSSVTRMAQRLGYAGWPSLRRDLRHRYLSRLSVIEVSDAHGRGDTPFRDSVVRDLASLDEVVRSIDEATIDRVARRIAAAESIYVTAQGSFAAVGLALQHNIQLAGYPSRILLDRPATIANHVSFIGPRDVLIVCSYWRLYDVAVTAAREAHRRGAAVILLSDHLAAPLAEVADEVVLVGAEGTSFFPSLTVAMSVQQGIVSTLANLDPERSRRALVEIEGSWQTFGLLHHTVPRQTPSP